MSVKNKGTRAIILKGRVEKISEEEIEKIKEQLVLDGYVGKLINYKELQELHKTYGSKMREGDFAQEVLEISYINYYWNVKNRGKRARILKERVIKTSEEEIKQIKERLVSEGYTEKIIDYEELQELHKKYGSQMKELDFAQEVLELSYGNYKNVKNKGTRAVILKEREIKTSKEEIEKIKEQLVLDGYVGKLINYEELQKLYQKYGSKMPEVNFAQEVLEISYGNYDSVKNRGARARILKGREIKTSKEEIEQMKQGLVSENYAGKPINYEELQELHQKYGSQMKELDFTQEVLELSYGNYYAVKNRGQRAKVLKERVVKTSKEEIEEIKEQLVLAGYAGKPINYEDLQELHQKYGSQMKELDFAQEVLEVNYGNYYAVKNRGTRAKILKGRVVKAGKEEIVQIKEKLAEKCIEEMKRQIEAGLGRKEILDYIEKKFKVSKRELLEIMQDYLMENGRVRISTDGEVGREDDSR